MKKKMIALVLSATLAAGMVTTASAATEVSFWTLYTKQEAVEPIVEAFNEANPDIKVTASFYTGDALKDACKVAASSDTLPEMWFNWGGSLGQFYVENEKTYDLTEYAKENNWSDRFSAGALSLCTLDGQLCGYPTSYSVMGVYYNKAIYEEVGIEVPETFEDFEENLSKLKEAGYTPMEAAGLNGWHVMRWLELLIEHYAGPEEHDKLQTFSTSWDCDAVVQAFTKYKEWADAGYFPDGFVTANPDDIIIDFGMGNCAMDLEGQWNDGTLMQNGLSPEDFGVFPFPSTDQNRMSAFAEMTQFNRNLDEETLDACMKFMDYYYSEENVEAYGAYYSLPLPVIGAKAPADQVNVEKMIETANANGTFTITDQAFPTEVADALFSAQDSVALGDITPEDAAKNIQAAIEAYQAK